MTYNVFKLQKMYNELQVERDSLLKKVNQLQSQAITPAPAPVNNDKAIAELKAKYESQLAEKEQTISMLKAESNNAEVRAQRIVSQIGIPIDDLPSFIHNELPKESNPNNNRYSFLKQ